MQSSSAQFLQDLLVDVDEISAYLRHLPFQDENMRGEKMLGRCLRRLDGICLQLVEKGSKNFEEVEGAVCIRSYALADGQERFLIATGNVADEETVLELVSIMHTNPARAIEDSPRVWDVSGPPTCIRPTYPPPVAPLP